MPKKKLSPAELHKADAESMTKQELVELRQAAIEAAEDYLAQATPPLVRALGPDSPFVEQLEELRIDLKRLLVKRI